VIETVVWKDGKLRLIDQTRLPAELVHLECERVEEVADAIRRLAVRGAPAIGVAAAYGLVLGLAPHRADAPGAFAARLAQLRALLEATRPTAVNLRWALTRMAAVAERSLSGDGAPADDAHGGRAGVRASQAGAADSAALWDRLLDEAHAIFREDLALSRAIGLAGAELLSDGDTVLTHCNAGGLATSGIGTALAIVYAAVDQGKHIRVLADETRPLFQGARLTAWELAQSGIPVEVICDGAAPWLIGREKVRAVIVGADRIAANGDFANKIGTLAAALGAKHHGVPFYVAAPSSTLDLSIASGDAIPIEERDSDEVASPLGRPVTPAGVRALNPAFDVTPASLVTAIVLEKGVVRPPFEPALRSLFGGARPGQPAGSPAQKRP
jgi:methylthioribose-1-phosphate isomerase